MKKIFFLLLFPLWGTGGLFAAVTVTPISTDYAAKKITFKVVWTNSPSAPYNNSVWVWVDFCPVIGTTPGGFAPATITGATITSGSGSTGTLTGRGFFITGSATNSGTTVTATLNPVPTGQFNWCVYGSDYPPNATMNNGTYALKGSSPFVVNNTTLGAGVNSFSGACITSLTDATGCPGIINNNFTPGSITTVTYNSCNNVAGTATTVATAPTGSGNYVYQWTVSYNNGAASTVSGATAAVYTPPATTTAGTYRYMRQVKDNLCSTAYTNSTGTVTRVVYATLTAGAINNGSSTVIVGTTPAAITSNTAANGGTGGFTYRWVRSGTSGATYAINNAGHTFAAAEVSTAGTWTYYRQVRDNTCATTTWLQSSGSYRLVVLACPYTGSDLYIDATHLCQQRTSGDKNWEAWIKDTRDNELYRIVYMPDNKWWLAQNVKLASYGGSAVGSAISSCTADECGRYYTYAVIYASYAGGTSGSTGNKQGICPPGWLLPVTADYTLMINAIGSTTTVCQRLRSLNSTCSPITDYYGFASSKGHLGNAPDSRSTEWYTNDAMREDGIIIDYNAGSYACNTVTMNIAANHGYANVRCFRQL